MPIPNRGCALHINSNQVLTTRFDGRKKKSRKRVHSAHIYPRGKICQHIYAACSLFENSDCFCFSYYCFDSAYKTESEKNKKKSNKKSIKEKNHKHILSFVCFYHTQCHVHIQI